MIVYHGGLEEVRSPELRIGENVGDFGHGFYVTSSRDQAARFVKTKAHREQRTSGFVSIYELDDRLFSDEFSGLRFQGPTREWAKFVSANRRRQSFDHDYDYVSGPVANDQVYATFSFYEGGLISFEMLIEQLKVRKLFDQILLHTEKAIKLLKFVESEKISWAK